MQTEYTYRTATADDWDEIALLLSEAFNEDMSDEWAAVERGVFEPDRTVLAETQRSDGGETRAGGPDEGREAAGIASAFTRDLTVPGGLVSAAHVTMVSVGSVHRRRGILRNMITRLHDEATRRREPVAVLWASEARIYQRFGYGLAANRLSLEVDGREAALRPDVLVADDGTIRKVKPADLDVFQKVYEQVVGDRPGWSSRPERWWGYVTSDIKESRGGATALRASVHDGPDGVDGYMLWRVKPDWGVTPEGIVQIRELVAATPAAYQALWRFALSVDLTRKATLRFGHVDEPLLHLVDEPRALNAKLSDSLWLRILSVPDALSARRYATPIDVVLDVQDRDIPSNSRRWRVVGDAERASCTPTDEPADLSLDVSALGAAYLGGGSLGTLAAAGRVTELRDGALAGASAAFGWHRAPGATEVF